ncbi:MAG: hypothetical protein EBR28_00900 [Planctomycetia bacterium]|nr:hypothetical protein [Planctomycetia bacterium]
MTGWFSRPPFVAGRPLRISFSQSGGLVGLVRRCVVNTDGLPPDEQRKVHELVAATGWRRSWARSSRAFDRFWYEIVIVQGATELSVECDDACVPARARPLVAYLKDRAK